MLFIICVSCKPTPKEGIVTQMVYEPQEVIHTIILFPVHSGKSTYLIPIPYTITDNEDYIVWVRYTDNKNKERTKKLYTSKECYDTLSIGKLFCVYGNCYSEDINNTKVKETK